VALDGVMISDLKTRYYWCFSTCRLCSVRLINFKVWFVGLRNKMNVRCLMEETRK
jgi:hypothetical protein